MHRHVVVLYEPSAALAVVVNDQGPHGQVEAALQVPLPAGGDPAAQGATLGAALEPYRVGRLSATLAVGNNQLIWQNLHLPPAPPEDLPAMVELQAQREFAPTDDGLGFDYFLLEGNAEHAYRLLGFGVKPEWLVAARQFCEAARLRLKHATPAALGWLAAAEPPSEVAGSDALRVGVGLAGRHATVWAMRDGQVRLLRLVWLPETAPRKQLTTTLAGELRRTLLTLAQRGGSENVQVEIVGADDAAAWAHDLDPKLPAPVIAAAAPWIASLAAACPDPKLAPHLVPLAGLAAQGARQEPPYVDLLHPHRPPEPPQRWRTYALAAVAGVALAALTGLQVYRNVQEPRAAAAAAEAQLAALQPTLEGLQVDERRAAEIATWLSTGPHVLEELEQLTTDLRPQPTDDPAARETPDFVVTQLSAAGRQWTLQGAVREQRTIQQVESQLRSGPWRVDRGSIEQGESGQPEYNVRFSVLLTPQEPAAAKEAP
jgi:hypothetical protein